MLVLIINLATEGRKHQRLDPGAPRPQRVVGDDVEALTQVETLQVRAAVEDGGELIVGDVTPVEREGPQPVHRGNPERFPGPITTASEQGFDHPRAQPEALEPRACPAGSLVDVTAADPVAESKVEVL